MTFRFFHRCRHFIDIMSLHRVFFKYSHSPVLPILRHIHITPFIDSITHAIYVLRMIKSNLSHYP